jgi:hypothetical protein
MNIFVLDKNPTKAANMLCDKHVVKMIVETAQMLCTTAHVNGHLSVPYKATHKNHPCTLWSNESSANWDWLVEHGEAMCTEYTRRYGRTHKTQAVINWCKTSNVGPQKNIGLTPFRQAMPDTYKNSDPVKAYRDYYRGEKSSFAKWRNNPPTWW